MTAARTVPEEPTELHRKSWWGTVRRTAKEFRDDNLTDWAAALTYYGLLALFPAMLVLVALLGLFGQAGSTTNALFGILRDAGAAPSAVEAVKGPIDGVVSSKGGAGALVGVGLLGALWSASGYVGAFIRASNAVYEINEGRPVWKLRPLQIVVTLASVFMLALALLAVVLTGPLARAVGDQLGMGSTAQTVWSIAKWPAILFVLTTLIAFLYYVAPNIRHPRFRWISPGGVVAVALWILATVGFFFYVANFGSYNKTYGTLGGLIALLVWMWISNLALLFGVEFDAELERSRELEAGVPGAETNVQLEPRQAPKDKPVHTDECPEPVAAPDDPAVEAARERGPVGEGARRPG